MNHFLVTHQPPNLKLRSALFQRSLSTTDLNLAPAFWIIHKSPIVAKNMVFILLLFFNFAFL